jgi:starvation-inducible DNA-binding protein
MNELSTALKIALANVYVMYFKAHAYHWNVEGPNFSDYHAYFATVYSDVYGSVDPIAENIRKLDAYAPFSLDNLFGFKTANEDGMMPTAYNNMFSNLLVVNTQVLESLEKVHDLAEALHEHGIAVFAAERIDAHKMHAWQLKSLSKNVGA